MSRRYFLSPTAINSLRHHKKWSLDHFGKATTKKYFADLDKGFHYIAGQCGKIQARPELTGESGLSVYPVREHYVVFLPMDNGVHSVDILRQSQDIPNILNENAAIIRRELAQFRND